MKTLKLFGYTILIFNSKNYNVEIENAHHEIEYDENLAEEAEYTKNCCSDCGQRYCECD